MAQINIETTQNVTISYHLAGLGSRILAFIIDYVILLAYSGLISFIVIRLGLESAIEIEGFSVLIIVSILFGFIFYDVISEIAFDGQSIGKKVVGIKVVMLDGSKPTLEAYLIRWVTRVIEGMLFLYGVVPIISIAVSPNGQRVGDIMAKTTVIRINKKPVVYRSPFDNLADDKNYVVKYPEVINLTDRDVLIIRESIKAYREFKNRAPIEAVTNKVLEMLQLKTYEGTPVDFLKTIVKDYYYLTSQD